MKQSTSKGQLRWRERFPRLLPALYLYAGILLVCVSCNNAVQVAPSAAEVVGEWRSTELPAEFLKNVGAPATTASVIQLNTDGSFSARSFPQRSPPRLSDLTGSWVISDPSITPTGTWSIELNGVFLQLRKQGGELVLRHSIDVLNEYRTDYKKTLSATP